MSLLEGRTLIQQRPRPSLGGPSGRRRGSDTTAGSWLTSPFLLAIVACVALAVISALVLPTVASYDPWSWIVWGREVSDPHLAFAVGGGPSWKPLPVIFTTIFGLFGAVAPTLWVITARVGGLLALVAAYRLAARLTPGPRWAGALAGVIAAAAVLLTQDWFYYWLRGTSEPWVVGAALWAIDRHLNGRWGMAYTLGVALALLRPEASFFVLGYGAWLWFKQPRWRVLLVAGLLAIPFFWFIPPWIGSGQPLLAALHAQEYNGNLGPDPLRAVIGRGIDDQTLPVLIFGILGVAVAWLLDGSMLALGLGLCVIGWWIVVVGMTTLDHFPGLERFFLPAAGLTCVLAGMGVVRIGQLVGAALARIARRAARRAARHGFSRGGNGASGVLTRTGVGGLGVAGHARGARSPWPVVVGVAAVVVAATIAVDSTRVQAARAEEPLAAQAVTRLDQLSAAVAAIGGHNGAYPCPNSFTAINHSVQTALAWKLHVTLGRVGTNMLHAGLMFVGPHDSIDGGPPPINPVLSSRKLIAQVGVWQVWRMTTPGSSSACVGH